MGCRNRPTRLRYQWYSGTSFYNEVLGTIKITVVIFRFFIISVVQKQRNIKSWDQQSYLVIRGFCYLRPLYNEVPLYFQTGGCERIVEIFLKAVKHLGGIYSKVIPSQASCDFSMDDDMHAISMADPKDFCLGIWYRFHSIFQQQWKEGSSTECGSSFSCGTKSLLHGVLNLLAKSLNAWKTINIWVYSVPIMTKMLLWYYWNLKSPSSELCKQF